MVFVIEYFFALSKDIYRCAVAERPFWPRPPLPPGWQTSTASTATRTAPRERPQRRPGRR